MSEDYNDFYYHHPFKDIDHAPFQDIDRGRSNNSYMQNPPAHHNLQMIDQFNNNYLNFSEFLHGGFDQSVQRSFGSPSDQAFSIPAEERKPPVMDGGENPTEAAAGDQEDLSNCKNKSFKLEGKKENPDQDGEDGSSKKDQGKGKKKAEKKQREPRFAFMTKSAVDHLEDGYRWRKYGQKAGIAPFKGLIYYPSFFKFFALIMLISWKLVGMSCLNTLISVQFTINLPSTTYLTTCRQKLYISIYN